MPEYNIGFSEKLIDAAKVVLETATNNIDGQRTVLYLSLLSSEIALKAFLESAGVSIREIRRCSHNHRMLLEALCHCEVEEVTHGISRWLPASQVCSLTVSIASGNSTVGALLSLDEESVSQYPNEIRYGDSVTHVPASAMLQASVRLHEWVAKYIGYARRKRDTLLAATTFCNAYGSGLSVGDEIKFHPYEKDERGQDYWIGYELINFKGKECGEITAGYIQFDMDVRLHANLTVEDETIESEAQSLDRIAPHNKEKNEKPKELEEILIKIAERATSKIKRLRGEVAM